MSCNLKPPYGGYGSERVKSRGNFILLVFCHFKIFWLVALHFVALITHFLTRKHMLPEMNSSAQFCMHIHIYMAGPLVVI